MRFAVPASVQGGALVGASVDVDPQEQGAQIVVSPVDEAQGRPLRWVRVVSGEYDTWYGVDRRGDAVGATAIKLWPGANQITAVASSTDGFDVGQSNYCFVTLAQ